MKKYKIRHFNIAIPKLHPAMPGYWHQRLAYKLDSSHDLSNYLFITFFASLLLGIPLGAIADLVNVFLGLGLFALLIIANVQSLWAYKKHKNHRRCVETISSYYGMIAHDLMSLKQSNVVDNAVLEGSIQELYDLVSLQHEIQDRIDGYSGVILTDINQTYLQTQKNNLVQTRQKITSLCNTLQGLHHEQQNLRIAQDAQIERDVATPNTDKLANELAAVRDLSQHVEAASKELMSV